MALRMRDIFVESFCSEFPRTLPDRSCTSNASRLRLLRDFSSYLRKSPCGSWDTASAVRFQNRYAFSAELLRGSSHWQSQRPKPKECKKALLVGCGPA